jgi:sulfur transfer protein SufE
MLKKSFGDNALGQANDLSFVRTDGLQSMMKSVLDDL